MENLTALGNIKYDEKEGCAIFSVNPKIYPLDIVYSAAYAMLDKAYIFLDGDPEEEILIELRPKSNANIRGIVMDFNEQLLNYSVYKGLSEKNKTLRESILQRVLLTNNPSYFASSQRKPIEDPLGIRNKWEEKEKEK